MPKFDKRTLENIHKLYYLAIQYPEKKISDIDQRMGHDNGIAGIFQTSPVEFNSAAWGAQDLGYMTIKKDNSIKVHGPPDNFKWEFGELVDHLMEVIPYTISKMNDDKSDIEENAFSNWTAGFPVQDVIVATKKLIEDGVLASYEVVDVEHFKPNRKQRREGAKEETHENVYTFYTLAKNAEHRWGEKQFKDMKKLQQKK